MGRPNLRALNEAIADLDRVCSYGGLSQIEDAIQDVMDASGVLGSLTDEQFQHLDDVVDMIEVVEDDIHRLGIGFLIPKFGSVPPIEWFHAVLLAAAEVDPERLRGYAYTPSTM